MQKKAWDGLRVWGGSDLEGNGIRAGLCVCRKVKGKINGARLKGLCGNSKFVASAAEAVP